MATETNKSVSPNRILAIKFSSIGDIILTTSPIISLKNTFPSSKIDLLTRDDFVPIVEGFKYLDKIIPFNKNASFWQLIKTGKWINNSDYDLVIDFHNSLRSKIIRSRITNIKTRILKKPRWKRFLLFKFRKNKFSLNFNQIQLLHDPINGWISDSELPLPELFVSDNEKKQSIDSLKNIGINKKYIVIIPGAAWTQKTWFANRYVELIEMIKSKKDYDFVILGSKGDTICSDIAKLDNSIINLQGITNLRESMAIISNSEFVIGSDTGFVHASEALGKNAVMILGPTSRETGGGVNRKGSVLIQNIDIWCRPCSQNGKRKCYRDKQYCMTTITANNVYDNMKGLLN